MNANRKRSNAVRWIDSSNKSSSSSAKMRKIGLIEQRWMQSIKDLERNRTHSVVSKPSQLLKNRLLRHELLQMPSARQRQTRKMQRSKKSWSL